MPTVPNGEAALAVTSPNSRAHPHPLRCLEGALRPERRHKGSCSSRVSAVEPGRAAGRINCCLGTYVCADAGTRDCLSFFLEPELKFTRVINGLASAIKASSITHSAKEGPEAFVSRLLFFSRRLRATLTRWRDAGPSRPMVTWGVRLRGDGVPP